MLEREKQITIVCVLYLITCLLPFAGAQTDEIVDTYPQWELPEAAKMRLGKGDINAIQFSPDGTQLAVGTDIGVWLYDVKTGEELSPYSQEYVNASHFRLMAVSLSTVVAITSPISAGVVGKRKLGCGR